MVLRSYSSVSRSICPTKYVKYIAAGITVPLIQEPWEVFVKQMMPNILLGASQYPKASDFEKYLSSKLCQIWYGWGHHSTLSPVASSICPEYYSQYDITGGITIPLVQEPTMSSSGTVSPYIVLSLTGFRRKVSGRIQCLDGCSLGVCSMEYALCAAWKWYSDLSSWCSHLLSKRDK